MSGAILLMSGALILGYCVASLFFYRFWRQTSERLFVFFAAAFLLLAVQRLMVALLPPNDSIYVVRLFAFVLIIVAIVDKNRQ